MSETEAKIREHMRFMHEERSVARFTVTGLNGDTQYGPAEEELAAYEKLVGEGLLERHWYVYNPDSESIFESQEKPDLPTVIREYRDRLWPEDALNTSDDPEDYAVDCWYDATTPLPPSDFEHGRIQGLKETVAFARHHEAVATASSGQGEAGSLAAALAYEQAVCFRMVADWAEAQLAKAQS